MNKFEINERKVYKLYEVKMKDLKVGDMFCLDDGNIESIGAEHLLHIYRCMSNPTVCVEFEVIKKKIKGF